MRFVYTTTTKGFSIGEVLIAIFVLTVGVIGAVELTQKNIIQTAQSRDAIVATMLAQEGVELVRNARDNNAAIRFYQHKKNSPPPTLHNVFAGFSDRSDCAIDYESFFSETRGLTCSSGFNLKHDENGFYTISSTGEKFRRRIVLSYDDNSTPDDQDDAYTVTSIVTWGESDNPPQSIAECTLAQHCIATQNVLTSWIAVEE